MIKKILITVVIILLIGLISCAIWLKYFNHTNPPYVAGEILRSSAEANGVGEQ